MNMRDGFNSATGSAIRILALLFCFMAAAAAAPGSPLSSTNIFAPASTPARHLWPVHVCARSDGRHIRRGRYFAGLLCREVSRQSFRCRPRTGPGVRKYPDRTGLDGHSGSDRCRAISGDGPGYPRDPGCPKAGRRLSTSPSSAISSGGSSGIRSSASSRQTNCTFR